jgi:hypothetical protein
MMYAVVYQHQHGVDVAVADDEQSAYEHAESIVREWRSDFDVPEEMSDGDALQDWHEITQGIESIEVVTAFHVDDLKDCRED